jgi:hypothetical protein
MCRPLSYCCSSLAACFAAPDHTECDAGEERSGRRGWRVNASSWIRLVYSLRDNVEIGADFSLGHTRFRTAEHREPTHVVIGQPLLAGLERFVQSDGSPERARNWFGTGESGARYTDDGIRSSIESDCLADKHGSPRNWLRQAESLTTTTAFAPGVAQSASVYGASSLLLLRRPQNLRNRGSQPLPLTGFNSELPSTLRGQRIEFRSAIVFRGTFLDRNPLPLDEAMQGWIQ